AAHGAREPALRRVVLQQVGEVVGRNDVADGDDVEFAEQVLLDERAEHETADATETVDGDPGGHGRVDSFAGAAEKGAAAYLDAPLPPNGQSAPAARHLQSLPLALREPRRRAAAARRRLRRRRQHGARAPARAPAARRPAAG